jgi:hypothetical protein
MVDAIDFYRSGPDADAFNSYNIEKLPHPQVSLRMNYNIDPAILDQKSKSSLVNRIQNVVSFASMQTSPNETGLYVVDDVVNVQCSTSAERADKQAFWSHYRNLSILTGILGIAGSIGSCVALSAVATTAGTIALVATAVAFAVFAGLSFYRSSQAQGQIDQWGQNPLATLADLRTNIYADEGFFFALQHNLQGTYNIETSLINGIAKVLHRLETLYVYRRAFESQKRRLDEAALLPAEAQASELDRFLRQCVLQQHAIEYVHGPMDEMRARLMSYHAEYASLHSKMTGINRFFGEKRREIFQKYEQAVRELDAEKSKLLTPYQELYKGEKNKIDQEYQRKALNHPLTDAEKQQWNARSTQQDQFLKMKTTPIETHYSSQKRLLTTWKETELQRVEGGRSTHLVPFFNVARNLFNRAYEAYINNISGVAAPAPEQEVAQHDPIILNPIPSLVPMPAGSSSLPQVPGGPGGPVMAY